ncbi:uncharacterized protein LOC133866123 [Alnus glutinosa]|uniref:uncharacterized protein LOC133866123 n=1 Tax=Alnus glutinosa TaxID=3517 RepID=UPI002D79FD27|nr:uncharacterized protein LOC133866123 [Alnus glutinosa]
MKPITSYKREAEAKFKQISAYDVLSNPQKRQIYDVYGEEGFLAAEAKFKQISAYDVLSDSQKRQIYEVYGEEGLLAAKFTSPNSAGGPSRFMLGVQQLCTRHTVASQQLCSTKFSTEPGKSSSAADQQRNISQTRKTPKLPGIVQSSTSLLQISSASQPVV